MHIGMDLGSRLRAQSSIEFITTYSFLIAIVAFVISIILVIAVSSASVVPSQCVSFGGPSCSLVALYTNVTSGYSLVTLSVSNSQSVPINITNATAAVGSKTYFGACAPQYLYPGQSATCIVNITVPQRMGTLVYGTYSLNAKYCNTGVSSVSKGWCNVPSLANWQPVSYGGSFTASPSSYLTIVFSVTAAQGPKSLSSLAYSAVSGSNTLPLNFTVLQNGDWVGNLTSGKTSYSFATGGSSFIGNTYFGRNTLLFPQSLSALGNGNTACSSPFNAVLSAASTCFFTNASSIGSNIILYTNNPTEVYYARMRPFQPTNTVIWNPVFGGSAWAKGAATQYGPALINLQRGIYCFETVWFSGCGSGLQAMAFMMPGTGTTSTSTSTTSTSSTSSSITSTTSSTSTSSTATSTTSMSTTSTTITIPIYCPSGGGVTCTYVTYGSNVVDTFTGPGTVSFIVPNGLTSVDIWLLGGGGGGGNGAGGGGGYTQTIFGYPVTPFVSYPIIVGARGTPGQGAYGYSGGNGGASYFANVIANGGWGAVISTPGNGGSGGGSPGGSDGSDGGSGGATGQHAPTFCPFPGSPFNAPYGAGGGGISGGYLGGGNGCNGYSCNGGDATYFGGGGGGGNGYGHIGGNGYSGMVQIEYNCGVSPPPNTLYVAQFNGGSSMIDIPYSSAIDGLTSNVAVSAWIKTTSSSGGMDIFSTYDGTHGTALFVASGIPYWYTDGGSGAVGPTAINDGKWHYVVGVYNGSSGNKNLYIDGSLVAGAGGSITASTKDSQIGTECHGNGGTNCINFFSGKIANVQFYSTPLSQTQILVLYTEGLSAPPLNAAGLVGWWSLNTNSNDNSGNGHDGTPTAITYTSP